MKGKTPRRGGWIPLLVVCFYAGIAVGWMLHAMPAIPSSRVVDTTVDTTNEENSPAPDPAAARARTDTEEAPAEASIGADAVAELRRRRLLVPIDGAKIDLMEGQFRDRRGGGTRGHEAVDILAARNTPVRAVEEGTIAKLFFSKAGGITIYQFDPADRYCFYYAHLERYGDGLKEGQHVTRGETIGYVGTSGNAPKNTPHLHFAIFALTPDRHWWQGRALDPFLVLRR